MMVSAPLRSSSMVFQLVTHGLSDAYIVEKETAVRAIRASSEK
jgi:hypothetical protein